MSECKVHDWFASTTTIPCEGDQPAEMPLTFTSHNGAGTTEFKVGTLEAFLEAHERGYRWMQVDVVLCDGELISHHAVFGRLLPFARKPRHAVTLEDLLANEKLSDVHWNIEIKSKQGLRRLLEVLENAQRRRDLRSIMISSPMRPSVLRAVAGAFPAVAVAAPVVHGGVFGVRFLGANRARVNGSRLGYDCQQVHHRFIRASAPKKERPLRQAFTVRTRRGVQKMVDAGADVIVESSRVDLPIAEAVGELGDGPWQHQRLTPGAALALGGGGWRSAFGGIGAIMYFDRAGQWSEIDELVGISGGSFVVAALAEAPPIDAMGPRMTDLIAKLQRAAGTIPKVIASAALPVVMILIACSLVGLVVWNERTPWGIAFIVAMLLATSFLVRLAISLQSTAVIRTVIGSGTMRDEPPPRGSPRCRIGATGLNDGKLYSFTTDPVGDRQRRADDPTLAVPLGRRRVFTAVARSTSLPGLGGMGFKKLYLCDEEKSQRSPNSEWVVDQLVDGGISGIFGRGLIGVAAPAPIGEEPLLVVVDAGRSLQVVTARSTGARVQRLGQRLSALSLLARWLLVAQDVSNQGELRRVADGQLSDGYRCCLVRLAEDESLGKGIVAWASSPQRRNDLARLRLLRDAVHSLSLVKASPKNVDRGIAVASAACALEFEEQPDIVALLAEIGDSLGRGDSLAKLWRRIPLLGTPLVPASRRHGSGEADPATSEHAARSDEDVELRPVEMVRSEAVDEHPGLVDVTGDRYIVG